VLTPALFLAVSLSVAAAAPASAVPFTIHGLTPAAPAFPPIIHGLTPPASGVPFTIHGLTPTPAGEITGRVLDPDGRPVPGATVLLSADGTLLATAMTDPAGRFAIPAPARRGLDLRIALAGFRAVPRELDLTAAAARDLGDIRLAVSAISESVVVSAAQVELPLSRTSSSVTVLTGEDLEARQVHSVADALRTVPGIAVAATGGTGAVTGVFPRGGESNFTLVYVDDVPVTAFGGEFDFGQLGTENVERIEIVRGPQSALFGSNAIGAVVRVVTRRGGAPVVSGTVEAGGYGTSRVAGATAGSSGPVEWGVSAERFASDGYNGRTVSGRTVQNDDYERASGAVSAGWRTDAVTVRGALRYATNERGVPGPFGTNPVGAYSGIDTISRSEDAQTLGSVSALVRLTPRVRGLLQSSYHRLSSDFASPFGPSESSSRRWTGRAQLDGTVRPGLDLSAGAELQRERAGSTFITDETFAPAPVKRTIAGYFAEARLTLRDRLFLTGGLRVDDIRREALGALPADDLTSVNPRAAVAWLIDSGDGAGTKLRASVATGIRPPGAFDIAFTDNAALKPERSRSVEAGVEHSLAGGRASIEAVAFANEFDDLIIAVGSFQGSSRYITDNISNARARGIELGLSGGQRIVLRGPADLRARIAYTLLDSEILAVDRDHSAPPPFTVGEPLLRRPRHQASVDLSATAGRLGMFLTGGARSRVLDVEPSLGTFGGLFQAPGFNTWNAGASWRLGRIGDIYGRVENLSDARYEEALGFPAPGRRATVGLRLAAGR
jgi:outer membrane cobalamin receptor